MTFSQIILIFITMNGINIIFDTKNSENKIQVVPLPLNPLKIRIIRTSHFICIKRRSRKATSRWLLKSCVLPKELYHRKIYINLSKYISRNHKYYCYHSFKLRWQENRSRNVHYMLRKFSVRTILCYVVWIHFKFELTNL